jgi:zinc transporter 9
MVVHKGPVAIGLATFLRSALWSPAQVHRGVLMFAATSPLAAVLTYGLLSALPGITDNIPLAVLFSGGTVLYAAAMHILPGAMQQSSSSGGKGAQQHQHGGAMNRSQLTLVSLGMLLPMVLSAALGGHHHHH